jgi:uncharacterized protein
MTKHPVDRLISFLTLTALLIIHFPSYAINFSADFNRFIGEGFAPNPSAGQLDSDYWVVTGFSDGDGTFGGTHDSGDFAKGSSNGGVSGGGVYAFEVSSGNKILGVQPIGADFTPGDIILKITNSTGSTMTDLAIAYQIWYYNNEGRASTLNLSWSLDNASYTEVAALDFTTPQAADSSASWQNVSRSTTLSSLNLTDGSHLYLRWQGNDVSGSGSRDEYGIDNITVSNVNDTTAPVLDNTTPFTPTNDATNVAINTHLLIQFNENIQIGTGNLIIKQSSDHGIVESFDVATSSQLTINSNTLTIEPTNTLTPSTAYYVELDSGAIQDIANNPYAGFSGNSTWHFMTAVASENDIFISEYVEGSSDNKAIELYNPTGATIDLDDATHDYQIEFYFNGNTSVDKTFDLTGTINAGEVYVLANETATFLTANGGTISPHQTIDGSGNWFNGNDAIVLKKGSTIIDVIGKIGDDPGSQWGSGSTSTQNNTIRRKATITIGDSNGNDAFEPSSEWEGYSQDTFDGLGSHLSLWKIHTIQGGGTASPIINHTVIIEGIVVGDFQGENGLKGFFVQEEDADVDTDTMTSESIFVYDGHSSSVDVNVGDKVRVTGQVIEYDELTEISSVTDVTVINSNNPLPTAITINDLVSANTASLERYEGMRVQFNQTLSVTESYQLGIYGTLVLSVNGPQQQFTHQNAPSVTGYSNHKTQIANSRILLDDGSNNTNPSTIIFARGGNPLSASNILRGGDTVTGLSGILDYRFDEYRIQTNTGVNFIATNPRSTTPPDVGGTLKIASFNVLNYFTTIDNGSNEARGADSPAELSRQTEKLIAALSAIDADIFGLVEVENNGYGTGSAIFELVNALNAKIGADSYDFVNPDLSSLGSAKIAVALIYKPATVTLVGNAVTKTDGAFAYYNRPPLVQTFAEQATGEKFTIAVNHFKSKGSLTGLTQDSDQNDGAGKNNYTRTQAAQELTAWLATDPTGSGDPDFLIMGDLNAYAQEDPIVTIKDAGYTDLLNTYQGPNAYTYIFDGQRGYLDHALANPSLTAQVTGVAEWHINADEPSVFDYNDNVTDISSSTDLVNPAGLYSNSPFRSSDHDPVIIGLQLQTDSTDPENSDTSNNSTNSDSTNSSSVDNKSTSNRTNRGDSALPPMMSVFVAVSGQGNVTSSPSGIDCKPSHCKAVNHRDNHSGIACDPDYCMIRGETATYLNLTPTPDAESEFSGWGGHKDCADGKLWLIGNRLCIAFFRTKKTNVKNPPQPPFTKVGRESLQFINMSTRAPILGGVNDVIASFILKGTGHQTVMIRGESLEAGVDPMVTVRTSPAGEWVGNNDNWLEDRRAAEVPENLQLSEKTDAGLLLDLVAGAYTVQLSSQGTKGLGTVRVDRVENTGSISPINLSTKGSIQGGANDMIMSFTLKGEGTQTLLLKGLGLEEGVDPKLTIETYPNGDWIAENDNWANDARAPEIPENQPLPKATDAALILDLAAGTYTITLSSFGKKGLGLIGIDVIEKP